MQRQEAKKDEAMSGTRRTGKKTPSRRKAKPKSWESEDLGNIYKYWAPGYAGKYPMKKEAMRQKMFKRT